MKTMFYYFVGDNNEIIALEAHNPEQRGIKFTTPAELEASDVPTASLLIWFNSDKPADKQLAKARSRADLVAKVFKELGNLTDEEQAQAQAEADARAAAAPAVQDNSTKAEGSEAPAAAAAAPSTGAGRGRKAGNAGKRLFSTILADTTGAVVNPRKAGSNGHKSMQLLIDAGTTGLMYEDYIAGGGRPQDLAWDIDKGNARVAA